MRKSRAVTTVAAALLLAAVGLATGTSAQANTPPSGQGPVEYNVHDALVRARTLAGVVVPAERTGGQHVVHRGSRSAKDVSG